MKAFLYYFYYRLYQWSEKRDKHIPMFLTVAWTTLTLFSNVVTFCALITIFSGMDLLSIWLSPDGNKYLGAARIGVGGLFVWFGLKVFHVHEKAFSAEMKKKYQEVGCKDWWVISYYFVSYILMGVSGWFAGARLGLH